jgi:hypothetical protein
MVTWNLTGPGIYIGFPGFPLPPRQRKPLSRQMHLYGRYSKLQEMVAEVS